MGGKKNTHTEKEFKRVASSHDRHKGQAKPSAKNDTKKGRKREATRTVSPLKILEIFPIRVERQSKAKTSKKMAAASESDIRKIIDERRAESEEEERQNLLNQTTANGLPTTRLNYLNAIRLIRHKDELDRDTLIKETATFMLVVARGWGHDEERQNYIRDFIYQRDKVEEEVLNIREMSEEEWFDADFSGMRNTPEDIDEIQVIVHDSTRNLNDLKEYIEGKKSSPKCSNCFIKDFNKELETLRGMAARWGNIAAVSLLDKEEEEVTSHAVYYRNMAEEVYLEAMTDLAAWQVAAEEEEEDENTCTCPWAVTSETPAAAAAL